MTAEDNIEVMLTGIAMGDQQAFGSLYDLVSPRLFGLCCAILGDEDAALDALQDVFTQIWQSAGNLRANGEPPEVWLVTLTRTVAVARLRELRELRSAGQADLPDLSNPARVGAPNRSPEAKQLYSCLAHLPADQAQAVICTYMSGTTYAELSTLLGSPAKTVRSALRQSLMQLRGCLGRSSQASQSNPPGDDEVSAAEYALGLLSLDELHAFEAKLDHEADLQQDVATWQTYLARLFDGADERTPPEQIKRLLERRLFTRVRPPLWRQIMPYLIGAVAGGALVWWASRAGLLIY